MPFDAETAAEAGKKSGEVRRRRKKPDDRARQVLLDGVNDAARALVAVATAGEGFEEVKPELRFKAALIVLEYVLGKPKGLMDESEEGTADDEQPKDPFTALLSKGGES
jgi:hypothetical protein